MNISCVLVCLFCLWIAEARVRGLKVGKRVQGERSLMKKGKAGPIFADDTESSPFLPLSASALAGFDPFRDEETHSTGRAHVRHRSHYSSDDYHLDIDMSQVYFHKGKGGKAKAKGGMSKSMDMSKSMMGKSKSKGKMGSSKYRPTGPTPDNGGNGDDDFMQTPQPTPGPTPTPAPTPLPTPTPLTPTINLMPTASPVLRTSSPTCVNVPTSPGPDLGDFFGQPPGGGNGFQDGFQDVLDDIQVPDAFQDCAR